MKKYLALLLALICMCSFVGCFHYVKAEFGSEEETSEMSEFVVKEEDFYYVILPQSGERVLVFPQYNDYMNDVASEMLKAAEPILKEKTEPYKEYGEPTYGFRFEDGRLYLRAQVYTEPDGWCGNRNYEVFQEPITPVIEN